MRLSNPIFGPEKCIAAYLAVVPVIQSVYGYDIAYNSIAIRSQPTSKGNIAYKRGKEKGRKHESEDIQQP